MEVLTESVQLANLPFSALLGAMVVYWLMVAAGFLSFDGGAEVHADAGGDAHVHAGTDAHVGSDAAGADAHADGHHLGFLAHVLQFVNIGEVPAMIVVSVLALWMWVFSMIANHYFSQDSVLRALAFVVPNVALSLVITRYLTWPLKKFFVALNREYEEHQPLVGRTCRVVTGEVTADFGQARIETKGAPLLIHVRAADGQLLRKGETGLVVREDKGKNIYYVVKATSDQLED
jgi:hypothetical protein